MNIIYYFEATHLQFPKSLPRPVLPLPSNGPQNHPNTCPTPPPFFAQINPLCLQTVSPYVETTPALKQAVHPINDLSPYNVCLQYGRIVKYTYHPQLRSNACPNSSHFNPKPTANSPKTDFLTQIRPRFAPHTIGRFKMCYSHWIRRRAQVSVLVLVQPREYGI